MPARKPAPDRNRQVAIVCDPCGYRLRGSRAQLVRGIPACPVCGEPMLPESWAVAEVILTPTELERHPEHAFHVRRDTIADRKSCDARGGTGFDTGMSDRWLREAKVNLSPRRWTREDFEALADSFVRVLPVSDPIPF